MAIFAFILIALGATLTTVGLIVRSKGKKTTNPYSEAKTSGLVMSIIGGSVGLLGLILVLVASIFTVPNNHVGVEILFGRIQATHDEGLHLKNPLSGVSNISGLQQESTYSDTPLEGEVEGPDALEATTSDQAKVDIDASILWSLDLSKATDIFREYRTMDQVRVRLLRPTARDEVRDCVSQHQFQAARTTQRQTIADCSRDRINTITEPRGLIVHSVQIRNMAAQSAEFQAGIDRKLVADQAAQEAEYRQRQAEVDAETARIQAAGEASAEIERAKGTAEANNRIGESLRANPELVRIREIEAASKDGTVYFMDSGQSPVLVKPVP